MPSLRHLDLCIDCEQELPIIQQACRQCAQSLPGKVAIDICGNCLKKPPFYDYTVALYRYEEIVSYLITRLKFHQQLVYAKILGKLLAVRVSNESKPDCIIPVPLHYKRLRVRGFNQALEIARPLAKQLKIKLNAEHCIRLRNTPYQSQTTAAKRYKNVHRAFAVKSDFKAKHVAIIDDVMTTGHTINELSCVLREAGVTAIQVWCVARAGEGK